MFDHNSTFNFYQAKLYHTLGFLSKRIDGVFILSSASVLLTFVAIQIQKRSKWAKNSNFSVRTTLRTIFLQKICKLLRFYIDL